MREAIRHDTKAPPGRLALVALCAASLWAGCCLPAGAAMLLLDETDLGNGTLQFTLRLDAPVTAAGLQVSLPGNSGDFSSVTNLVSILNVDFLFGPITGSNPPRSTAQWSGLDNVQYSGDLLTYQASKDNTSAIGPLTGGYAEKILDFSNGQSARIDLTPVPEPGTGALVLAGVLGVVMAAWRKAKSLV